MRTLIGNVLIVTMNDHNDIVDRGAIVVDGNRITYCGPAEWTRWSFDRTIDAGRMIAMPGMVNAHCRSRQFGMA
jgi:5-methylthioadenosine/S-adenosylhomocysteine deaminase